MKKVKTGIKLEDLCDTITLEFADLLRDFFTDNFKVIDYDGEKKKEVTERLLIDKEINLSHYIDISLNYKGTLLVRVRKHHETVVLDYEDMPATTRTKVMYALLLRYQFKFKKEYLDLDRIYDLDC